MEDPIDIEEYNGYEIGVFPDDVGGDTPRDWDNLGRMVCWHSRYSLGDEEPKCTPEEFFRNLAMEVDDTVERRIEYWENGRGWQMLLQKNRDTAVEECEATVEGIIEKALKKHVVMLDLYLYDHSGITMRTTPFSCPWDSGQVGYIYVVREDVLKEFSAKILTPALRKKAVEIMQGEVEVYDQYLTGEVYGYMIRKKGEDWEGGCWGFYGDIHDQGGLIEQAKDEVDWSIKKGATA